MAAKVSKITEMANALYDDGDIAAAVVEHAAALGNTSAIEEGRMTLPGPHDATTWYERDYLPARQTNKKGVK